jgi:hypothetical protein
MQLRAAAAHAPDPLVVALYAAEVGEPYDIGRAPSELWRGLFDAVPKLRRTVPFATFRLLGRLITDARWEVRAGVAQALPWFAEVYPDRIEELLLPLACDPSRRVRTAAAEALAVILRGCANAETIMSRWQTQHPDRAREVMERARALAARR